MYKDLSHLSKDELEVLISKYYEKETRVKDLITEYSLDINSSQLLSLFPPLEHDNVLCKYCNIPMFTKRTSKSEANSRYKYPKTFFCLNCNHQIFENSTYKTCNCSNCELEKEKKFKEKRDLEKDDLISIYNLFVSNSVKFIPCDEKIKIKLYLSTMILGYMEENLKYISGFHDNINDTVIPTSRYKRLIINTLIGNEYIRPSLHTSNAGKILYDDEKNISYSPFEMIYELNILIDGYTDKDLIELITSDKCVEDCYKEDLLDIWKEIGYYELIEYLYYQCEEFNLYTNNIGDKIEDMVKSLLDYFSISESMSIIYSAVKSVAARRQKDRISNNHAINTLYSYLYNSSNKILIGEWSRSAFSRNYDLPQSIISKHFFDVWLKIGNNGFTLVPRIDYIDVGFDKVDLDDYEEDSLLSKGQEFTDYAKSYIKTNYNNENKEGLLRLVNGIESLYKNINKQIEKSKEIDF